jgi:hypothetical protein
MVVPSMLTRKHWLLSVAQQPDNSLMVVPSMLTRKHWLLSVAQKPATG